MTQILIGRSSSLVGRESIWRTADGLEIQSTENFEVVRRRVLFEDVTFVTLHRRFGTGYLVFTGIVAFFFLTIGMAILAANAQMWPLVVVFFAFGVPALIAFLLRLLLRVEVITILGRRTKATVHFRLSKKRGREAYENIVAAVREAQAAADEVPSPPRGEGPGEGPGDETENPSP